MDLVPVYLTKQHASIISDLKPRMLEAAIRAGHVRAFKLGKKVLIDKVSLREWIESHEITPVDRQVEKTELAQLMDRAIQIARKKTA
jgi:hypothetical protein